LARFPFESLINEGFSVKVQLLNRENIVLENAEIQAFQVVLQRKCFRTNTGVVSRKHYPSIDIPPKLRGDQSGDFVGK
jgi:hypothetical protein